MSIKKVKETKYAFLEERKLTQEEKLQHLQGWVNTLAMTAEDIIPQIREVLAGKTPLLKGCPSKESMAALLFNRVKEKLGEVQFAVEMVDESIFED